MSKVSAETGCVKGVCYGAGGQSYGTYVYNNGDTYVGEWRYGEQSGKGIYTFSDGSTLEGIWSRGKIEIQCMEGNCINGIGLINNKVNGHVYFGDLKDYQAHGEGALTVPNGSRYSGEFKNNKMDGIGTYEWSSGSKYIGGMKNNLMHGQGTIIAKSGYKLIGEYLEGRRKGIHTKIELDGFELKILYNDWGTIEEYLFENETEKQKWLKKSSKKNQIQENAELKCVDTKGDAFNLKFNKNKNQIFLGLGFIKIDNQNVNFDTYLDYILTNNDRMIIAAGLKSFTYDGVTKSLIYRIKFDKYNGDLSLSWDELDEKGFQIIKTLNGDSYGFRNNEGKANCKKKILN